MLAATELNFTGLLLVIAAAVLVPLALGLVPKLPIPSVVFEIVAGILIGPGVLGLVKMDEPIRVLSTLGVAFLLFLAGFELNFDEVRGRALRLALLAFGLSAVLALALTVPLGLAGVILNPLLVAIILTATSLGIIVPILKDTGNLDTALGRLVVVACSVAEFGSIVLLSMFFSTTGPADPVRTLIKLGGMVVLTVAIFYLAMKRRDAGGGRVHDIMTRLADTSAQIRVRVAVLLLLGMLVISHDLGFESVLGAFMAGALLSAMTDPERDPLAERSRAKLEAVGFGLFVPVFFVATGIQFPITEVLADPSALLRIPLFFVMLLIVRGVPARLLRKDVGSGKVLPAAFMQATSLSFIVVGTQIGVQLGIMKPINAASFVAAGMLSVLIFPGAALSLLKKSKATSDPMA